MDNGPKLPDIDRKTCILKHIPYMQVTSNPMYTLQWVQTVLLQLLRN